VANIFLVNYKVQGIKNLDSMISLSFYKKTIRKPIDTQNYNIKGIYGINGSGKSAIIMSVDILRNLLVDEDYLNNPMVQNNLNEIINKKTNKLYIESEFLVQIPENEPLLYNYLVELRKDKGKYFINSEKLSYKNATSKKEEYNILVEVSKGEIIQFYQDEDDKFKDIFISKTANLLYNSTISSLFKSKIISFDEGNECVSLIVYSLISLILFGTKTNVYMDKSDDHIEYFLSNMLEFSDEIRKNFKNISDLCNNDSYNSLLNGIVEMDKYQLNKISVGPKMVLKDAYMDYANMVQRLEKFIQIFKPELTRIEIEKKENEDFHVCSLNMVYGTYSINAEFESTGIKKLIKLFAYLQAMVHGEIIFIDEFDSNLHDVYLCALIEYLMEYGKGQLCFTTHNVGPMDILKSRKKSIDFLSLDHKIYPWTKNGNYSPSKLYRNGMIEGSPFNIDSIDFIGIFDVTKEDEE